MTAEKVLPAAQQPRHSSFVIRNPVAMLRQRLQAWFQSRLPLSDTLTLNQRNVYILPTRPGLMLALTLLVLLIASINYQLNLGYLLTFLLAGCVLVGMHVCHGTLRGLTLNLAQPEPVFAGANAPLRVSLTNARRAARHGIGLAVLDAPHADGQDHWAWADVPGQGSCSLEVAFQPRRRGLQRVPTLTAETRFPLGTFRVWTVWRPAAEVLVYPAPEAHPPPLPPGEPRAGTAGTTRTSAPGEFEGVRAYRRGDPLKLVVWKKAAKGGELVSRDTAQAQRTELWLDSAACGLADPEARLSRLAAWVLLADKLGLDYGLRVPGQQIAPDAGPVHKRRCLEALALC